MIICLKKVKFIKFLIQNLKKLYLSQIVILIGLTTKGGSSTDILKKRINELKCDVSHFGKLPKEKPNNAKYTLDEILVENSSYANIARLKIRLVNENRLVYKCAICGISEWNDLPLSL